MNYFFFYLGLLLSSIDSFPLFAGVSSYAPYLSVLCFTIFYFTNLKSIKYSFGKNRFFILIVILISTLFSFFCGLFIYEDIKGFLIFFIQIFIATILYKSFNLYFKSIPPDKYTEEFSTKFLKYSMPILLIGVIEIFLLPLPSIYNSLVSFFSFRVTIGRIQLLSGEPSWASRYLLTILSLMPLTAYSKKKKTILYMIIMLLVLATGSSLGILCVGAYFLFTYFRRTYLKYFFIIVIIAALSAPIVYSKLNDYTKARLELITQLATTDLGTLASTANSGSIMARIGNPIIGMHIGIDNPILGIGGGYYYKHHYDYLGRYFPMALSISNVHDTGMTAKNLFSKIFSETGLFGLLSILICLLHIYKRKIHDYPQLFGIFVAMILLTVNFDSLFHIFPLLLFCFLLNLPSKNSITIL